MHSPVSLFSFQKARTPNTLANDTIRDILITVPVKFLILLKSICQAWSSLSGSSSFISDHLHYYSRKNPILIINRLHWDQEGTTGLEFFLLEIQKKKIQELHIPKVTDSDIGFKIVGSCNGLICVCHYSLDPSSCLFIWNPATGQIRRIPEQSNALLLHKASPYCLLGFCHNAYVNDYEIVRIYSVENRDSAGIHAIRVEKYSRNSGFWNEVEYSYHGHAVTMPFVWVENSVTVKRKMFWVAMTKDERFNLEFIVSFDIENDVVRKISVPTSVNFEVSRRLTRYGDSLGVLIFSESESMERCIDLWIFDDGCNDLDHWTKVKTFQLFSKMDRLVGMWKNEVFIASGNVIHSLISGFKGRLPPSAQVADGCSYVAFSYVESLVPVNGGNENQIGEEGESNNIVEDTWFHKLFKKMIDRLLNELNMVRFVWKTLITKIIEHSDLLFL